MPADTLIPPRYTFLNPKVFLSIKATDVVKDLLTKLDKRDPDMFNMYIYNDYFGYAHIDLVDKQLSSIHAKIVKKDWNEAYHLLEAFSVFLTLSDGHWTNIDDGERVGITDRVYGASMVTVLRALKKEGRLDVQNFPSLETLLREGSSWGRMMHGVRLGVYRKVFNGIGYRLFKDKPEETLALEKARVEEWINSLPTEEQKEVREALTENKEEEEEEEEEENNGPWYGTKKDGDEDHDSGDYLLSRMWKEYKTHLQTVPTKPLRGPPEWDISKWTQAQRAPFSFENMDD